MVSRVLEIDISKVNEEKAELAVKYFTKLEDYWKYMVFGLEGGMEPEPLPEVEEELMKLEKEMTGRGFAKIKEIE